MGFRCPVCITDFGQDKAKWRNHIANEHAGIGITIVTTFTAICENRPTCFGNYTDAKTKCRDCEAAKECYAETEKGGQT